MSGPSRAERNQARELVAPGRDSFDWLTLKPGWHQMADRVAQALADQRARYEAVADELTLLTDKRRRVAGATPCCDAADRIRSVAERTT